MSRWVFPWLPAAFWAAFLFFMSSRQTLPVSLDSGLDKVAHFGAYLILGFLFGYAVYRARLSPLIAIALGWVYGALDEIHQSSVPGRIASFGDWLADAAGVLIGLLLYYHFFRALRSARSDDELGATEITGR